MAKTTATQTVAQKASNKPKPKPKPKPKTTPKINAGHNPTAALKPVTAARFTKVATASTNRVRSVINAMSGNANEKRGKRVLKRLQRAGPVRRGNNRTPRKLE
jgi:hypothetical protein